MQKYHDTASQYASDAARMISANLEETAALAQQQAAQMAAASGFSADETLALLQHQSALIQQQAAQMAAASGVSIEDAQAFLQEQVGQAGCMAHSAQGMSVEEAQALLQRQVAQASEIATK